MKKQKPIFFRLLTYARPYWKKYLLGFLCTLVMAGISLLLPRILQILIDVHFPVFLSQTASVQEKSQHFALALSLAGFYFLAILLRDGLTIFYSYQTMATGGKVIYDLRRDLYQKVLHLPMAYFDQQPIGAIVTRITNDTDSILEMFGYVLVYLLKNLVLLLGILTILFSMDFGLASLVCFTAILACLASLLFQRAIRKVYDIQRKRRSDFNTLLSESLSGMSLLRTFHLEQTFSKKFDQVNQEFFRSNRKEVRYFSFYRPGMEVIQTLALVLLVWFGGASLLQGKISFGLLYAFISYLQSFFFPIFEMAEDLNRIQSALASAERIYALFDQEEEKPGQGLAIPSSGFRGEIAFDHVYFRYKKDSRDGDWILEDVSFRILPGQFVAFVGATGAGKSTILGLLARFYEPDRGEIRIDGININAYDRFALRRNLGIVQQDVFLFRGSILSNITMDRAEIDQAKALDAAKLVYADDFIQKLKHGYAENVLEGGSTLSAGQRQLLSFARTLAPDPSILILDEATANIDTQTEERIQQAIRNMAKDRTMLAVAHRISTIADADRIIVLQKGKIAEEGSREELLAKDGLFRILYRLQYKGAGQ